MRELTVEEKRRTAGLIGDIHALAYLINETTNYCVFTGVSGHVKSLEIRICRSKENFNDVSLKSDAYFDPGNYYYGFKPGNKEDMFARLNEVKYKLKKILREHKIDYSSLPYEIEEIKHYYF